MASQSLPSIVFFLFFCSYLYYISYAHYSPSSEKLQSPIDFLTTMNETHKGEFAKGISELKKYLTNLGYTEKCNTTTLLQRDNDFFDDILESAIKKYQEFYNLKITGVVDQQTIDSLSRPRCGFADFQSHANITSLYTFLGTKWPPSKRHLTFSYPKNIRQDARVPVAKALVKWMRVSPFRFIYTDDFQNADVKISFERRSHGDGFPFDGPGGILAHSFFPTIGRLHFDADERWQTDQSKGTFDLQSVALHELGHILGLGHSSDHKASMYAYFKPGEIRDLNNDDIRAIQTLYPK